MFLKRPLLAFWLPLLIGLLLAGALLSFAYNGTFARMIFDDYCTAVLGLELGAWDGMLHWYNNWAGSYTTFIIKSAMGPYQPAIHSLLVAGFIALWLPALLAFFWQVLAWLGLPRRWSLLWALVLLLSFATINSSPGSQKLYWMAAFVPYTLSIIPLTISATLIVWVLRQPADQPRWKLRTYGPLAVVGVLAFITGGLSETLTTFQVTALVLLIIAIWFTLPQRRAQLIPPLLLVLLLVFISMAILVLSPGYAIRQAGVIEAHGMGGHPPLPQLALSVGVITLLMFVAETYGLAHYLFVFLAVVGTCLWLLPGHTEGLFLPRRPVRWLALGLLAAALLVGSVVAPALYAANALPERIFFIPRAAQIGFFMLAGYVTAVILLRSGVLVPLRSRPIYRLTHLCLIALMIGLPLLVIASNLRLSADFRTYATEWDARHEAIIAAVAAGQTVVEVPPLSFYLEDYLLLERVELPETNNYRPCGRQFYGADAIIVTGEAPSS